MRCCRCPASYFPLLAGVIALVFVAAERDPPAFDPAGPQSQGAPAEALRDIADVIRGHVREGTILGAELVVIKNRRVVLHETFGWRDRENEIPWEKSTICNIRSMSKCLTGAAAQILIDEGKLSLEDPVAKYLESFDNERSRGITVRHLLEHRSGLPLTMLEKRYSHYESLRAVADPAGERGPDFEPGSKFQYSDTGSDVLGVVVEEVSGRPLEEFVRQRLLEPLSMHDTFVYNDTGDPRRERIAALYIGAQRNWQRFWGPGDEPLYPFECGSQSLYSTPLDYARFLAMWMDGGTTAGGQQLLSPAAIERTLTPVSDVDSMPESFGSEIKYGQMAILWMEPGAGAGTAPKAIGHSGSDGTWAWAWPKQDLMVLYFTQSRGQATGARLKETIDRLLINPRQPRPVAEVPPEYEPFLGVYLANFASFKDEQFTVKAQNGHLALDIPSQLLFQLRDPDDEGLWHFAMTDEVAVSFGRDDQGWVNLLRIHQGGLVFEVPRKGTALAAEMAEALAVAEEEVRDLLGRYDHPERQAPVEIVFQNNRLYIKVTEGRYELRRTDGADRWTLALNPAVVLRFDRNDAGEVVSITRIIGGQTLEMRRLGQDETQQR